MWYSIGVDSNQKLISVKGKKKPQSVADSPIKLEEISPSEINAPYVIDNTGFSPTAEIIDLHSIDVQERKREDFIQNQPLVKALEGKSSTADVIDILLIEIAHELAALKWEKKQAASEGKNVMNHIFSCILSLQKLSDVLFKRKEMTIAERIDLKSPRFQKILNLWLNFVYESMKKSSIPDEQIDVVFQQMKADMLDWERLIADV